MNCVSCINPVTSQLELAEVVSYLGFFSLLCFLLILFKLWSEK